MGERSSTNGQPNNKPEGYSMKDQSSGRPTDKQNDHSSFSMKRSLNDAINPFNTIALGQYSTAAPPGSAAMEAYIRAWDVQFEEATRRNEAAERSV